MKGSHLDAECVPAAADYKWNLFLEIFPSRSRACVCLVCFCRDIYLFTFTHVSRGILKCGAKRVCQMCCWQSKRVTPRILFSFSATPRRTTHLWVYRLNMSKCQKIICFVTNSQLFKGKHSYSSQNAPTVSKDAHNIQVCSLYIFSD